MPTTRMQRTLPAPPADVWRILNDPYHQERWWPRVRRVEDVDLDRFTQVLATQRGKGVRADFAILAREEEELLQWEQLLEGSPFERLLEEAVTTFTLAPADDGTVVAVELQQRTLGWSRLAPWLYKRAARRQLGEALDALAELVTPPR
ncbi:SRPBCC family protein [Conexibacter sp. JD483]|uniref:SRPBCC family protein n=1 Tax=unclassified Conexibacter TaxID=2627773 RepID=UPI00271B7139|nr:MULTISPECIES: SRPBCC family protein [unclassified Conexibacter]MDO8188845.1 SRPBCC family protein [Conexibacter sp. CPCC 205706]MDO8201187.1 SRPBCC family protein [Conexibacter sp. CPCC 205762]MDR9371914.1 SRPBCC family protein [Conexibacter sp. JD483]